MGLFHHDDNSDSDKNTCPSHSYDENAKNTIVGGLTFYHLNIIISAVAGLVSIVIMLIFKQMHATHLSNPNEQVKIMRIGTLITMFAVISFLSIAFPKAEVYIHPWLNLVESFALCSFFLLLCDFISPNDDAREVLLAAKKRNGAKWFRTRWIFVFQLPVTSLVLAVAADVTAAMGIFCEEGGGMHFAKFWINLFQAISLTLAMLAIFQFYSLMKVELAPHRPLLKLIAFKAIVSLTFFQQILFWILTDTKALKESDTMTYADLHIGLPNLVIAIEMVPLALFFYWAYPWSPYKEAANDMSIKITRPYQGGPLGIWAWLQMLNPSDTLKAIVFAFKPWDTKKMAVSDDSWQMEEHQPLTPAMGRERW